MIVLPEQSVVGVGGVMPNWDTKNLGAKEDSRKKKDILQNRIEKYERPLRIA